MSLFAIHTEYIQLNQLLKVLGWVASGAEANEIVDAGLVQVNGNTEKRRRNKIYPGYRVSFNDHSVEIVSQ